MSEKGNDVSNPIKVKAVPWKDKVRDENIHLTN